MPIPKKFCAAVIKVCIVLLALLAVLCIPLGYYWSTAISGEWRLPGFLLLVLGILCAGTTVGILGSILLQRISARRT